MSMSSIGSGSPWACRTRAEPGSISVHGRAEGRGGFGLHAGHDELIEGHVEGDAAVAEALAHHLGVDVLLEQDRGMGVAQVVEACCAMEFGAKRLVRPRRRSHRHGTTRLRQIPVERRDGARRRNAAGRLRLQAAIQNTRQSKGRAVAWTVGPRLVPVQALVSAPAATDELDALFESEGSTT